ncbi:hypothetical protein TIFTF001_022299 [Ficus carica]|uniref:Uncharacterized protein n=1 Tax=Ficus carica TaxID=3494 RepID=A0AA88DJY9_FICCA|nr:hypothetical protein TIFTF001_022299 [Ficus carica]
MFNEYSPVRRNGYVDVVICSDHKVPLPTTPRTRPDAVLGEHGHPSTRIRLCSEHPISGNVPRTSRNPRAHTPLRQDWMLVTRLRLTRCGSRRTRPDAVLEEHGHQTKSYRLTRATPSTQTRLCSEHSISGNVSPTYCYNTSHSHPSSPTLTGAAPAGVGGGHPAVPSTSSPIDLSIRVPMADTTPMSPSFLGASLLQMIDGGATSQPPPDNPTTLVVAAEVIFGINRLFDGITRARDQQNLGKSAAKERARER